jgi:hypothetical protein
LVENTTTKRSATNMRLMIPKARGKLTSDTSDKVKDKANESVVDQFLEAAIEAEMPEIPEVCRRAEEQ